MTPAPPWKKKKPWSRPLADLIGPAIAPLLAKQGFGESEIIMAWPEIVGPRYAGVSEPIRLQWPPQGPRRDPAARPEPAILHVRVDGGLAIELQHMQEVILQRINRHLGWRCVARLALKQGPLERAAAARRAVKQLTPEAVARGEAAAAKLEEGPLRDALARLGARVLGEEA
jgi:hypothetical protein